jgi:hypothetical protein
MPKCPIPVILETTDNQFGFCYEIRTQSYATMWRMPARHVIDLANRIVLTVFTGVLTVHEIAENSEKLHADVSFDPAFSELIDFSAVSRTEWDSGELKAFLKNVPFSTASKHALVAGLPDSLYGASQMYRMMRDNQFCVGIFHTIAEASRWLISSKSAQ